MFIESEKGIDMLLGKYAQDTVHDNSFILSGRDLLEEHIGLHEPPEIFESLFSKIRLEPNEVGLGAKVR